MALNLLHQRIRDGISGPKSLEHPKTISDPSASFERPGPLTSSPRIAIVVGDNVSHPEKPVSITASTSIDFPAGPRTFK
jgi:hypothetical protein